MKTKKWQNKLQIIIHDSNTPSGRLFDLILFLAIVVAVTLFMLESIETIDSEYHTILNISEWVITILFTVEYIVRIISARRPWRYILSFYGIIDLLSMIPKYLSLMIDGSQLMSALRALRLLRIFRVFKLGRFIGASNDLGQALKASQSKISVFLFVICVISMIIGTVMYLVEASFNEQFSSIPKSIYWTIVTLTTVGYGDITPVTPFGQFIASVIMILGYGIIAVPTGIVTSEITRVKLEKNVEEKTITCPHCEAQQHSEEASYCFKCGERLIR